jgi:hypothetical protein
MATAALIVTGCSSAPSDGGDGEPSSHTEEKFSSLKCTRAAFRTSDRQHYLTAENGGGGALLATATAIGAWEIFTLVGQRGSYGFNQLVALKSFGGSYVVVEDGGSWEVNVNRKQVGRWETLLMTHTTNPNDQSSHDWVRFRSSDGCWSGYGCYLSAQGGGGADVFGDRVWPGEWERFEMLCQ